MRRLNGRIAVVSGGASGIGRATAMRLASEGAIVEILDKDDAGLICAEIAAAGGAAQFTLCDVTDEKQIAASVRSIKARHGKVDILVNNAGILTDRKPWHMKTQDELERMMQVNYLGLYALTRAIYPLIKKSSCGRIVIIGSRTAFVGNPGMAGYIESKAAVMGFTRVLARELGAEGITVNAVAPGMIATPGTRAHSEEQAFDRMMAIQAIKRRVEPEHVAGLVAFLASDDAELITGQTIVCDGGGFLH
jgi:NAD(P)-dependent dehydrogenase (short-subunit alcohol dehydrogenase family)